jgi:selenocysteine-specific elongation factor
MTPDAPQSTATRLAVVGTAGHIDHGKTALVKRLTGVDTDRLPEEKARGISIDLGFARLVTPAGVQIGIVDVPGHERFVKNMLAGVGGIDCVLLVIAADESVMPQTREHFAIVQLLGIPRGVIVLTKSDLVEPEWLTMVEKDARALVKGTALADAPVVPFSALTGAGEPELLAALDAQLAGLATRSADEPARLPVDRVFTVEGFGTVVTGTLWRGHVRTGDTLALVPGDKEVRVRRVQVHGTTVDEARAGQRTAVALHGVDRAQVERGHWLIAPGSLRASRVLDVRFELLPGGPRALKPNTRVRFHLGAAETLGRLVLLEGDALEPGHSALAQLRLEGAVVAARGDRFVIRSYSPVHTIGGGTVIEPVAERRRRRGGSLESLAVHESGSLEARLLQRLENETRPASTAVLAQTLGESEVAARAALDALLEAHEVVMPGPGRWLAPARWDAARDAIESDVRDQAAKHPARYGVLKGELKSRLKGTLDAALFDTAFESLILDAVLEQRGERVRPAGEPWVPPAAALAALERLEAELESAGFSVPDNPAWQSKLGSDAGEIMALGLHLDRLVRVNQDFTYTTRQMDDLRGRLSAHFAQRPTLVVGDFKEIAQVSRKFAVPLLEHADRSGWTQRVGDERRAGTKLTT